MTKMIEISNQISFFRNLTKIQKIKIRTLKINSIKILLHSRLFNLKQELQYF